MKIILIIFILCNFNSSSAQSDTVVFSDSSEVMSRLNVSDSAMADDSMHAVDSLKFYNLSVISNFGNASVYIDTSFSGKTPLLNYKIKEGNYKIKVVNPYLADGWQNGNQTTDLNLNTDTTISVKFKYFYYFNSVPFNAQIFFADTLFGKTPLRIFTDNELKGNVLFKKNNYTDYNFNMKNYNPESGLEIILNQAGSLDIKSNESIVYKNKGTQFKTERNLFAILGLGVASITGAYFSVNYKNTANEAYDDYIRTGNRLKLEEANSNDTSFVISLILMQAAIGGLMYFLFFD